MISGSSRPWPALLAAALLTVGTGDIRSEAPPNAPCRWNLVRGDRDTAFNQFQFVDTDRGYGQDGECLWKTENGGRDWQSLFCTGVSAGPGRPSAPIGRFQFVTPGEAWMQAGGRLWHSRDSGVSWAEVAFSRHLVRGFRFLDARRGWWVGEESLSGVPDSRGVVVFTEDGGGTWSEQATGIPTRVRWRLADVWPVSAHEVWAVGDEALLHSTDGGQSWKIVDFPELTRLRNVAIRFLGNRIGWILRRPAENFLLSTDGGRRWQSRPRPAHPAVLDDLLFTGANEAWATAGGIYHSSDAGRHWKPALAADGPESAPHFYGLQYLDRERLLIASGDGVFAFCTLPP